MTTTVVVVFYDIDNINISDHVWCSTVGPRVSSFGCANAERSYTENGIAFRFRAYLTYKSDYISVRVIYEIRDFRFGNHSTNNLSDIRVNGGDSVWS